MAKRKVTLCRTKYGRLSAFDRAVTALRTESAVSNTWSVTDTGPGGEPAFEEPPREAYRSYLMAVRVFEAPTEDINLGRIFDDVQSFALDPATAKWVTFMRERWERVAVKESFVVKLQGEDIAPRQCFRLLAYTEDLHYDPEYEARQARTDRLSWQIIKMQGSAYASVVANTAIYLRSLARDDPATGHWFVPREEGKESAVEWLEAHWGEDGDIPRP